MWLGSARAWKQRLHQHLEFTVASTLNGLLFRFREHSRKLVSCPGLPQRPGFLCGEVSRCSQTSGGKRKMKPLEAGGWPAVATLACGCWRGCHAAPRAGGHWVAGLRCSFSFQKGPAGTKPPPPAEAASLLGAQHGVRLGCTQTHSPHLWKSPWPSPATLLLGHGSLTLPWVNSGRAPCCQRASG